MMDVADLGDIAQEEIIKCLTYDTWRFDHDRENELMSNKVCILGSFNVDMISYVPRLPLPGESLLASRFLFSAGGKGNNQAQAASFAGTQVHFITKVGSDQFSDYAMDFISTSRVKTSTIYQTDQHRTGTASIFVAEENGENIIAIYPGANMHISAQEVRMQEDKIRDADIILLQLETNIEALNEIIAIGNRSNIPVMLNPAPYSDIVAELIPQIDYLTPNQTEAGLISGIDITDIASAQAAALAIYQKGVGKVIITLGVQGSMAFDGMEFIHSPSFPAVVKNTAGAGDAFSGSLAASLAKGESLKYALCYASAFASLAVETSNASEMADDDSVLRRIKQTTYIQTVTRYIGKPQEA
jgi:ribokinase